MTKATKHRAGAALVVTLVFLFASVSAAGPDDDTHPPAFDEYLENFNSPSLAVWNGVQPMTQNAIIEIRNDADGGVLALEATGNNGQAFWFLPRVAPPGPHAFEALVRIPENGLDGFVAGQSFLGVIGTWIDANGVPQQDVAAALRNDAVGVRFAYIDNFGPQFSSFTCPKEEDFVFGLQQTADEYEVTARCGVDGRARRLFRQRRAPTAATQYGVGAVQMTPGGAVEVDWLYANGDLFNGAAESGLLATIGDAADLTQGARSVLAAGRPGGAAGIDATQMLEDAVEQLQLAQGELRQVQRAGTLQPTTRTSLANRNLKKAIRQANKAKKKARREKTAPALNAAELALLYSHMAMENLRGHVFKTPGQYRAAFALPPA